ncbi:MAG: toxic anion resistance protein [Coriobacteriia bacterium]|nr:toxic anion resistance protein [Coriobacteriia bacterium]
MSTIMDIPQEETPQLEPQPAAPAAPGTTDLAKIGSRSDLNPEQQALVDQRAQGLTFDINSIQAYGSAAQQRMSTFTESALGRVRGKDMGEVGGLITNLMVDLKGFNPNDSKGIMGLFRKAGASIAKIQARYTAIESSVDKVVEKLKGHEMELKADVTMLDTMYDENLKYYQDLTLYILAGNQALEKGRADLATLQATAQESGEAADAEKSYRLSEAINLFEKRLYDLQLTRTISIQTAPQIRLIQGADNAMVNKIDSTINNTIPLWKQQLVLAKSLFNQAEAEKTQAEVDETTNELLKRNSAQLKAGSIEAAKASERGIVEVETLEQTNQDLMTTLDEVLAIQKEGHEKRQAAEVRLQAIEGELKAKLLETAR